VTSSTSLLLRVKHQRGGQSVYVNDGAYGSLMEVKFMHFTPPVRVWRGPRLHDNDQEFSEFTIWGPTCDSYDVLPQVFTLPADIDEDDWIEFGLMGAYTQASLTPFNGFDRRDQYWVDEVYTGKDQQPEQGAALPAGLPRGSIREPPGSSVCRKWPPGHARGQRRWFWKPCAIS